MSALTDHNSVFDIATVVIDKDTKRTGPGPWLSPDAIVLGKHDALKISAFNMIPGDSVRVKEVLIALDGNATHQNVGCLILCPGGLKITDIKDFTHCSAPIVLSTVNGTTAHMRDQGVYVLEYAGPGFISGTSKVTVTGVPAEDVSDAQLMCCRCTTP